MTSQTKSPERETQRHTTADEQAASSQETAPPPESSAKKSTFVETALKLSGKSEEEARTTGAIDQADEDVEALFAKKYQTTGSPVHRAVWEHDFPVDLFAMHEVAPPPEGEEVIRKSTDIVRHRRTHGTLYNEQGRVSEESLAELGKAGYWGLLIDKEYGGFGVPFNAFAKFLTRMATVDPTLAGTGSVHSCIGAVDPIVTFGTEDQKKRYLPLLASGERLSGFALTEPNAGSDMTALRTTAVLDGDEYVVNGEKLFITNAIPGRTIGLVCLIDDKPAVLIVDLPEENEHFQVVHYGLHALRRTYNNGLRFQDFRVPKENLLQPASGDGLTVAYHGLNRGRVALCATAAGSMRLMLANILPWAHFRRTYGAAIETRELVQRRIGRMASMIVGCDALTDWCSRLLDAGYRGEIECIVAKIFGSECQKDAAIELFMKTHGGRAFVEGHIFGDNVHDFLAPCIYEGEGEMLGMAFFKALIKNHGKTFFEPIGQALHDAGIKQPNPLNPMHAWALRKAVGPYLKWRAGQTINGWKKADLPKQDRKLAAHAQFAADQLQRSRLEIDSVMTKYQLSLADRQCTIAELSQRLQDLVTMLVTSLWASQKEDELVRTAADVLCQDLKRKLTGERPSGAYFKTVTGLGKEIASGGFKAIAGVETAEILMPYDEEAA